MDVIWVNTASVAKNLKAHLKELLSHATMVPIADDCYCIEVPQNEGRSAQAGALHEFVKLFSVLLPEMDPIPEDLRPRRHRLKMAQDEIRKVIFLQLTSCKTVDEVYEMVTKEIDIALAMPPAY